MHPSIKNILQSSVFILLALAIWEYGSLSGWWRPFLFPAPSAINGYLEEAIRDNSLWAATVVTIRRLLLGYLAGISIGIPAGLLSARFQLIRNTIGVLALGFQGLPSVCWVPLAILWFGQEEAAILFVVSWAPSGRSYWPQKMDLPTSLRFMPAQHGQWEPALPTRCSSSRFRPLLHSSSAA